MVEAGLIKYWKQFYWPSDDECSQSGITETTVIKVYVADVQGAFYVLLIGRKIFKADRLLVLLAVTAYDKHLL